MTVNYVRRLGSKFDDLSGILEQGKLSNYRGSIVSDGDLIIIERDDFFSVVLIDYCISEFLFGSEIPISHPSTEDVSSRLTDEDYNRFKNYELFRVQKDVGFNIDEVEVVNIFEEEKGRAGSENYSELVARFIVRKSDGTSYHDFSKFEPWYDSIEDLVLKEV